VNVDDALIAFIHAAVDLANSVGYDLNQNQAVISERTGGLLVEFINRHDELSHTLDPDSKERVQ
jgi:hypothetical protein